MFNSRGTIEEEKKASFPTHPERRCDKVMFEVLKGKVIVISGISTDLFLCQQVKSYRQTVKVSNGNIVQIQ